MVDRNPHAGQVITEDDATIAAALEDVSIPTLLVSMVHMTGDPAAASEATCSPQGLFLNEVQGYMSEEDKAEARRARPRAIIRDYRDRGCPQPAAALRRAGPRDDELARLRGGPRGLRPACCWRRWSSTAPTPAGSSSRRRRQPPATAFPVVVIGCGQSGLLAGIRLQEAGIPFTIIEKNAGVGGTWWENPYPGARVDVGNHFYCYSFEPSDHWTEFFAQQPELQRYFEDVMDQARHRAARPLRDRGAAGRLGRRDRPLVGRGPDRGRDRGRCSRPGRSSRRSGQLNRPHRSRHPGLRRASTGRRSTPPAGTTRSTTGQAGGHDRGRGERLPDRPGHRPRTSDT